MGDWVQVKRAGEVIPQIIAPDSGQARPASEQPWRMPREMSRRAERRLTREEDEAAIYCPNIACPGRQLEGLVHFTSRGAMDIRGLSYARIEQLVQEGLVNDPGDLYTLTARAAARARGLRRERRGGTDRRDRGVEVAAAVATAARAGHQARGRDRRAAPGPALRNARRARWPRHRTIF